MVAAWRDVAQAELRFEPGNGLGSRRSGSRAEGHVRHAVEAKSLRKTLVDPPQHGRAFNLAKNRQAGRAKPARQLQAGMRSGAPEIVARLLIDVDAGEDPR